MTYFKIGNTDYSSLVKSLKVDREYLTSSSSGRNAKGDLTVDLVNKKWKLGITFIPMELTRAQAILQAVDRYVINVAFLSPYSGQLESIQCYISTPSIDYYTIQNNKKIVNGFSINFIEL